MGNSVNGLRYTSEDDLQIPEIETNLFEQNLLELYGKDGTSDPESSKFINNELKTMYKIYIAQHAYINNILYINSNFGEFGKDRNWGYVLLKNEYELILILEKLHITQKNVITQLAKFIEIFKKTKART